MDSYVIYCKLNDMYLSDNFNGGLEMYVNPRRAMRFSKREAQAVIDKSDDGWKNCKPMVVPWGEVIDREKEKLPARYS